MFGTPNNENMHFVDTSTTQHYPIHFHFHFSEHFFIKNKSLTIVNICLETNPADCFRFVYYFFIFFCFKTKGSPYKTPGFAPKRFQFTLFTGRSHDFRHATKYS